MARRKARQTRIKRTKPLFVISTEGRNTERIYFESFKPGRDGTFRIEVLPNTRDKSSPKDVINRLLVAATDRRTIETHVEYWAVLDRDAWPEEQLSESWRKIRDRENFFFSMSNPCFELWLYLHLCDNKPFTDRRDCQKELEKLTGKDVKCSGFDPQLFVLKVHDAIDRAKLLDENPKEPWPTKQGSRVYRLVESLW